MQVKGRRTMARHLIRALGGIALAGACLALAACTSSAGGTEQSGSPAAKVDTVPVKNGTVTVKEGNKVICVMTVVNGKGTCKVSASTIGVGSDTIVGYYSGKGYKSARSVPAYVSVVKPTASATKTKKPS
jgi:hypothetical protein